MEEKRSRLRRAQKLRKNMTREERHLWYDYLKTYPLQFKRQFPVGSYIVDFYCYKAQLVIELDGSQHCEDSHRAYDEERTRFLEAQGLLVVRYSNTDVMQRFNEVCMHIDMVVKRRVQSKG